MGWLGRCVYDDAVNQLAPKFEACDGLVVGSPVYYASANATLVALLTRLFYSTPFDKSMKVGASVVAVPPARGLPLSMRTFIICTSLERLTKPVEYSNRRYTATGSSAPRFSRPASRALTQSDSYPGL